MASSLIGKQAVVMVEHTSEAGDDTVRPLFGQHVVLANPGLRQLFIELGHGPEWTWVTCHES